MKPDIEKLVFDQILIIKYILNDQTEIIMCYENINNKTGFIAKNHVARCYGG